MKVKDLIYTFLMFILFFTCVKLTDKCNEGAKIDISLKIKNTQIKGVVVYKKRGDKPSSYYIRLRNKNKKIIDDIDFTLDYNFSNKEEIEVGDSILKDSNSYLVTVKRGDSISITKDLNLGYKDLLIEKGYEVE